MGDGAAGGGAAFEHGDGGQERAGRGGGGDATPGGGLGPGEVRGEAEQDAPGQDRDGPGHAAGGGREALVALPLAGGHDAGQVPLTELASVFLHFRDGFSVLVLASRPVTDRDDEMRDLAALVVPEAGWLAETGNQWEPYRLLDAGGAVVVPVAAYFAELQAAGCSVATIRSYGLDLLRWWRFLAAAGVAWDKATTAEARDFARWMQVADKPARVHWRHRDGGPAAGAGRDKPAAALGRGA
jgi:hypothetical protein